ncbi:MAG: hypothetical protein J7L73_02060 [Anaerolineales bacterium]|nr:hypothetical protein [Anaerolineales bacterium]
MSIFICPKCGHKTVYDPADFLPYCEHCGYQSPELSSTIQRLISEGVRRATAGDKHTALKRFKKAKEYPLTPKQKSGVALWLANLEPNLSDKRKYAEEALLAAPNEDIRNLAEKALSKIKKQILEQEERERTEILTSLYPIQNNAKSNQAQINQGISQEAVVCPSCGAGYLLPTQIHSITCPYCLTSFTQRDARKRAFTPADGIIPFTIDSGSANNILSTFLKEEDVRIDTNTLTTMPAIYLPVWVFQITLAPESLPNWNEPVSPGQEQKRSLKFENIPISATKHLSDELIFGLNEYAYDDLNPYHATTSLNAPVEVADVSQDEAIAEARIEVSSQHRKKLEESGSKIEQREIDIQDLNIQDSKLIFIPAWLASYYYRGSLYHILINGQNGHITAEHPPFP